MADCRIKLLDHPKSHQCALVEMKGNTIRLQMWVKNDGFTEGQVAKVMSWHSLSPTRIPKMRSWLQVRATLSLHLRSWKSM